MRSAIARLAAAAAASLIASTAATTASANASLNGDAAEAYYLFNHTTLVDVGTFVVPSGGSFSSVPYGGGVFSGTYTFTGDQISITAGPGGAQWGDTYFGFFVSTSRKKNVTGITLDDLTTANGVTASDAAFSSNPSFTLQDISFYLKGQTWAPGQSAIFDLQVGNTPVPEPSTWAILLAGLGVAGAAIRRRRAII